MIEFIDCLDPDVKAQVSEIANQSGAPAIDVINALLRLALATMRHGVSKHSREVPIPRVEIMQLTTQQIREAVLAVIHERSGGMAPTPIWHAAETRLRHLIQREDAEVALHWLVRHHRVLHLRRGLYVEDEIESE